MISQYSVSAETVKLSWRRLLPPMPRFASHDVQVHISYSGCRISTIPRTAIYLLVITSLTRSPFVEIFNPLDDVSRLEPRAFI